MRSEAYALQEKAVSAEINEEEWVVVMQQLSHNLFWEKNIKKWDVVILTRNNPAMQFKIKNEK